MISELPQQAIDFFYYRTFLHISFVRKNLEMWAKFNPNLAEELFLRADIHDCSKFKDPEIESYIWRTWKWHNGKQGIIIELPEFVEQNIKEAIFHHVSKNRHHPEYHRSPNDMTEVDLIEMVCDWKAMSQEIGEQSPIKFAENNLGKRFKFEESKIDLIKCLIQKMDELAL